MRFLAAFLLLICSPLALADATLASGDAYTVYAAANGQTISAILESVKGIVQSDSYLYLLTLVAVLAFVGFAIMATMDAKKIEQFIVILVVIVAVTEFALNTTADVVVQDPYYGTVYTVQDVPAGVALPISFTSVVGHEITSLMETYFSTPVALQVSKTGNINMMSSLVQDASRMSIQDSNLRATMAAFSENCILPSMAQGMVTGSEIVHSVQLFGTGGTLANVNPSLLTPVYGKEGGRGTEITTYCASNSGGTVTYENYYGTTVTADNAYTYISNLIEEGAPGALARGKGVALGTPAYTWLENGISSAQTYLSSGTLTASGGDSIRQAAAANMLTDGLSSAVAQSGDSALASSVALAQATKAQESNWVQAAAIFNDISGYIYSLLQALMMGLIPLFLVAFFVPGTKSKILVTVSQVFVWLALWQPTFAILNFIITEYAQGPFGGAISDSNYSMMTAPIVSQTTDRFIAAAGFMGASIPMITWGIVKGGMALTSFVGGALGQQFASAAGNMASTGNISLGNESYDNYSANSTNAAGSMNLGVAGTNVEANPVGASTMRTDMGGFMGTRDGQAFKKSYSQAIDASTEMATQEKAAASESVSNADNVTDSTVRSLVQKESVSGGTGSSNTNSTSSADTAQMTVLQKLAESEKQEYMAATGTKDEEKAEEIVSGRLSATFGGIFGSDTKTGQAISEGGGWKSTLFGAASGTAKSVAKGSGGGIEGRNSTSASVGTETKDTEAQTTTSSTDSQSSIGKQFTVSDQIAMKQDFAKKYGEEIGKNTSESVQSMESYKQDAQKAESAEMKASEELKQNRSIAGPEKINSMSDLMGIVDQVDQGVEAMTSNNVSYGQEDQLRERYQDASADIRGRVDNNRPLIQEKTENAGPKTPIPEPKTAEELAAARARSGYDTDNLKDADVTRQDAETATEGSDAAAQRAMEEANKSALEGPIPFKERFNASQQKAMTDSEAGLLDVSRYGDVLSGQGGSIAKAVLGAAGYKGLEALSEKGAERHLQNKAADALDPDSKMPDKERSTLRKAMNRVGSAMDSLKEAGGKKIDSFKGLHKGLQEVGDFKKFANNDQVQKAIGRVYGESWLEKQAGKAGISTVAGATGVGAAVSAVMAASTAYDVVQGAEQLNSIVGQYNATKDLPGGPQINTDGMDTVQTPTSGEGGSRSNNIGQGLDVNRTVAEQEQAYSAIDSPGLQQFARDTNLGNSTLLNVNGETGNTYLEDIESQTISPEQAVASGQVRESEINSLPTGFVKT